MRVLDHLSQQNDVATAATRDNPRVVPIVLVPVLVIPRVWWPSALARNEETRRRS